MTDRSSAISPSGGRMETTRRTCVRETVVLDSFSRGDRKSESRSPGASEEFSSSPAAGTCVYYIALFQA